MHLYWPNKTGNTFIFSNAFEVVDEIIACYLARESTIFITLKRGNRTFSPAIKDLACMSSWHRVIVPSVWGVASLLEPEEGTALPSRAWARASPKAQQPSHLPVAALGCPLHPFSPSSTLYWLLQWPRPDFAAWIRQGAIAVRRWVLQAGDWDNRTKPLHAAGRRDVASLSGGRWDQAFCPQALNVCATAWACVHMLWA